MTTSAPAAGHNNPLRGILLMCAGVVAFTMLDAVMKGLAEWYSPAQVTFLRSVAGLPFVLAVVPFQGGFRSLASPRAGLMLARGMLGCIMLVLFVFALSRMTLADTYAIAYTAPLFVTALSVPLLKERVGIHRWAAVVAGFAGILVMVGPNGGSSGIAALAALFATLTYALSAITGRTLSRTETVGAMSVYYTLSMGAISGVLALFDWRPLVMESLPLLLAVGIFGTFSLTLVTSAYRAAPASIVSPFEYTSLFWTIGLGYYFWGELPQPGFWYGAPIVIGAGLYILYRETSLHRQARLEDTLACDTPLPGAVAGTSGADVTAQEE